MARKPLVRRKRKTKQEKAEKTRDPLEQEIAALRLVYAAFMPLSQEVRRRIISYLTERFGL
jgi:hypothetical protein